jgi:hypothetical protein
MRYEIKLAGDEWVVFEMGVAIARYPLQQQALSHVQRLLSDHAADEDASLSLDYTDPPISPPDEPKPPGDKE